MTSPLKRPLVGFVFPVITLSACYLSPVTEIAHLEVGQFLQDPLPYDGKPICLSGLWQNDSEGVLLASKSPTPSLPREVYPFHPILSVDAFEIDPSHALEIELCGVITLDPYCLGVGVPADRYPVCLPNLIELKPLPGGVSPH